MERSKITYLKAHKSNIMWILFLQELSFFKRLKPDYNTSDK